MKLVLSALAAAAMLAAVPSPASAACIERVEWRGTSYAGWQAPAGLKAGRALHGGVSPACRDTVIVDEHGNQHTPEEEDTPLEMRRIRGVSPRVALLVPSRRERVYLAFGFLPRLASHPLHDRLYPKGLDERSGRRCGPLRTIRGRLPFEPGAVTRFAVDDGSAEHDVTVDGGTRVRGGRRVDGTPRFREGDRLRVAGRTCRGGGDTLFVARRIRVRPAAR